MPSIVEEMGPDGNGGPSSMLVSRSRGAEVYDGRSGADVDVVQYLPSKVASTSSVPMGTSIVQPGTLQIRQTASAGRGVFAATPLKAGTLVEVSHVLLFDAKEYEEHGQHTLLHEYTYVWSRSSGEGSTMALALGIGESSID